MYKRQGLNNPQVVRTADMMDMICIVFVRGKAPDEMLLALAEERGIAVMATDKTMFTACGLLYSEGPVSYTHLDVYKRQASAWCSALWRPCTAVKRR